MKAASGFTKILKTDRKYPVNVLQKICKNYKGHSIAVPFPVIERTNTNYSVNEDQEV